MECNKVSSIFFCEVRSILLSLEKFRSINGYQDFTDDRRSVFFDTYNMFQKLFIISYCLGNVEKY